MDLSVFEQYAVDIPYKEEKIKPTSVTEQIQNMDIDLTPEEGETVLGKPSDKSVEEIIEETGRDVLEGIFLQFFNNISLTETYEKYSDYINRADLSRLFIEHEKGNLEEHINELLESSKKHKIASMLLLSGKINREILSRDLSELPIEKLIRMYKDTVEKAAKLSHSIDPDSSTTPEDRKIFLKVKELVHRVPDTSTH